MSLTIRPVGEGDREWVLALLREHWGGEVQASRGQTYDASTLPGLIAVDDDDERLGLVTYRVLDDGCCDLGVLETLREGVGVGTALLDEVARLACDELGCTRLVAVTTNDNRRALSWYQRRGFRVVEVREGAVDESRRTLKPSIPATGVDGVPIHDEIELSRDL